MKQKFLRSTFGLLFFLAVSSLMYAQPSNWYFTNTGANHTVLLQTGVVTISGNPIAINDVVGVFYDSAGTMACGGYAVWDAAAAAGGTAVTAWGSEAGVDNGFQANEVFTWKLYQALTGQIIEMAATYLPFPNLGTYTTNGTSGLATLSGTAVTLPFSGSGVATDLTCYGTCNGAIDLTIVGGTPPYNFTWSNGDSTEDLSGLCGGTYDVTVTDASGGGTPTFNWTYFNTGSNQTILLQPNTITVNGLPLDNGDVVGVFYDSAGTPDCCGYTVWAGVTSAITAWGSEAGLDNGLQAGETFMWKVWKASDGAVVDMVGNVVPTNTYVTNGTSVLMSLTGTYTPTTSASLNFSFTIVEPAEMVVTDVLSNYSGYNVSAGGATDGSIDLSITGGTLPYTYTWSNGASTEDLTNIGAGPYSVTVLDGNGCAYYNNWVLSEPPTIDPLAAVGVATMVSCNAVCDGSIDLTITDGIPPYEVIWSNGATTEDLSALCAGTYDVTITDASGPTVGPMPWDYFNTGANHSILIQPGTVTINNLPLEIGDVIGVFYDSAGTIDCCGFTYWTGNNAAISAWGSEAGLDNGLQAGETFIWKVWKAVDGTVVDMIGNVVPTNTYVTNGTSVLISMTGSYIPPSAGFEVIQSYTITEPAVLAVTEMVTDVLCYSAATGAIDLSVSGGTAPYTYSWSNGAMTEDLSGLTAGTYDVTVTDANMCEYYGSYTVMEASEIIASTTSINPACFGGLGSIDLTVTGGMTPYSFAWSNGATTEDLMDIPEAFYQVTITDANSCTVMSGGDIYAPMVVSISEAITNILCYGDMTGAIDLTVYGGVTPYTFAWSNTAASEDLMNVAAGTYMVTVTDANMCVMTASYEVMQPDMLAGTVVITNVLCNGGMDGAIDLTLTGGVMPYTFNWNNMYTTEDISGLAAGTYEIIATDANGCTFEAFYTITEPDMLTLAFVLSDYSGFNVSVFGAADGTVDMTVAGGTAPYTYSWSNSEMTEDLTGLAAGTYDVTVTDANMCEVYGSITLTEPPSYIPMAATFVVTDVTCMGGMDGAIDMTVTGGELPFTYEWSNSEVTEDIMGLMAGTYYVTVTDALSYTLVEMVTIADGYAVVVDLGADMAICEGGSYTLDAGTFDSYLWSTSETTMMIDVAVAGMYSVEVIDANGCVGMDEFVLTVNPLPVVDLGADMAICEGGMYTLDAGMFDAYLWSTNETTMTIDVMLAGTYTVEVTDANGCMGMDEFVLSVNPLPVVDLGADMAICEGDVHTLHAGMFDSFLWSTGETTMFIDVTIAGTYSVESTDANGCVGTDEFVLTVNPLPVVDLGADMTICDGGMVTLDAGMFDAYLWSTMETTMTIDVMTAGVYSVEVTDMNGCMGMDEFELFVTPTPADPVVVATPASLAICLGESFDVDITFPYTTEWEITYDMGMGVVSENIGVDWHISEMFTPPMAGTFMYTIISIKDLATGCMNELNWVYTFTVNALPVVDLGADMAICDGGTYTLDAGMFDSYLWSTMETTMMIDVMVAGTYTVEVTDANGCMGMDEFVLTVNPLPVVDLGADQTICEGNTVTLDAGMFDAYVWSNGESTMMIDVTDAGTYSVEVTDANGCMGMDEFILTVNPLPVVDLGPDMAICEGDMYTLDAGMFDAYLWSTGETTMTIDVMVSGTYSVEVTDMNGCMGMDEFVLTVDPLPVLTTTVTTLGGYNQAMGSGDTYALSICSGDEVTHSAPSSISIDPSACGELRVQTAYTSTLPNIPSQTLDASYVMAVAAGPQTISPTNATGMAQTITFVSTAYYDVDMSGSLTTGDVSGLPGEFVLTVHPAVVVDLGPDQTICDGAMVTLDAGMFDSYLWSTGATTMSIDVTMDGTYSVEVTDANGCMGMDEFVLTVNPTPVVDLGADMAICEGGMYTLDAGMFETYLWSTGETTMMIDVMVADTYTVEVTDMNGCIGMDEFVFTVNPLPVVDLGADQYVYYGDMATLDAGMFDAYLWSNGETTMTIDVMDEGMYSVEVTDANGCMGYDEVMVYIMPELTSMDLIQSEDMSTWSAIPGDLTTGYFMSLNPSVPYFYIDATSYTSSVSLGAGMYGFTVNTYPSDWFTYWAAKGVDGTVTGGWEDQMWLIINGNAPIFYLKIDAMGVATVVDGLLYDFAGTETYLRVNGDYLSGMYTYTGMVSSATGVNSDPIIVNWEFSAASAAVQAAIDGTNLIAPALVEEMNGNTVVFNIETDYPTFSPNLPQDLLVDALIDFTTPLTAGAIVSVAWNGNPVGNYTMLGTETSLWLSQTVGNPQAPLYVSVDAIWTISIAGLEPGMYDWTTTIISALAANFNDPLNRYELATALTVIDVYTVAPDITEMMPVDSTLLDGWVTLTITTVDPDDMVTYLEVDVTKVGVTGTGQTGGQWMQFDIPTDQAQIAQINAAYVGIAVLGYNAGVFTININTQAVANPFLDFPGWGDGEYIFWYIAHDEYGNQSGIWGDPMYPVDHITYFIQTQYDSQTLPLAMGYSIISTFIDPAYPNVSDVFGAVNNVVLVKDENGNPYWPYFGLNNVGNMVIGEGYQVKMDSNESLEVLGTQVAPETIGISLPAGWSLFGYLRTSAMNAVDALSSVTSSINVIKTGSGLVYWPAFGYNSIINMNPGVGYKARMLAAATLYYPSNTAPATKSDAIAAVNKVYTNIQNTGFDMTLGIPASSWENYPAIGDEVAVYTESGMLVGAGVYTGENLAITIWGNDRETAQVDGMVEGSAFNIKLMHIATGIEEAITVNEWYQGNGLYGDNEIAVVGKLAIADASQASQLFQNVPNPVATTTQIRFFLANDSQVSISVYNVLGEKLEVLLSEAMSEGEHTVIFNAENYAVGTYMYTIETPNFIQSKQMTVVR
ncbi:MAG: T9SS type A sorting domain-containing protein [Bacteroidales bacterium]|nr:T9SS type A sorting domain-containing protein [Bacteroidales bacterium]MCF8454613.1 T9SS type A sorting domain-containing protein [Bacteroidales bacterium]